MRSWRMRVVEYGVRSGVAVALVFGLGPLSSVAEQHESPAQFWLNATPSPNVAHPFGHPHFRPTFRPPGRPAEGRSSSPSPGQKPAGKPDFVFAVFGDAFGAQLARGLTDAFAGRPAVAISDRTADDAELTAVDPAVWVTTINTAKTQTGRLDAALILLGGDDLEPLRDPRGVDQEPGTAAWRELYGDRVEKLAATFRDKHIPLIWVGLPIVRDEDEAKSFADRNAIIRDRAPKGGAIFVDSWEAFADESGQYSATGPDVNGQTATLRHKDGWDFTRAGARKLASFVEGDLKREQDRATASSALAAVPNAFPDAFDQALSIDINAQIRREAGVQPAEVGAGMPSDATHPAPAAKPEAGPVLALTAPPLAVGGTLAAAASLSDAKLPLAATAFSEGLQPGTQHGRTDDFAWPPHP